MPLEMKKEIYYQKVSNQHEICGEEFVLFSYKEHQEGHDLESIPIILADTSNDETLLPMAEQAGQVLNCEDTYRFYGKRVVIACVERGGYHGISA